MAVSSSVVRLVRFYLLCTCCCQHQHHAALLSSNSTSGHSVITAVRDDNVANTTVIFDRAPAPLLRSQVKTSWPAIDGVSWSSFPKQERGAGVGGLFTIPDAISNSSSRVDNCTDHVHAAGSVAESSASGNGSATQPSPRRLQELRGVPRRCEKKSGRATEGRNPAPLCRSYHRTASLLRGRVDCSGVAVVAVAVSALVLLLCSVAGTALLLRCVQRNNQPRQGRRRSWPAVDPEINHDNKDGPALTPELLRRRAAGPRPYSYRELAAATKNFAESRRIGCGAVYRGYLAEQDRDVAVKVFSAAEEERGRREFDAEVEVMSQLRHRNVVRLVGWCDDGGKGRLLLAYELAPGGSLDRSLHDTEQERLLTWPERYRIALGLGAAVLYLHTECERCVVHGDIKPSNIMLDSSCNAKLGDFGLARLVDHGAEPDTTQVVAGTLGYMDPEFVSDRRRCPESDVYSFGVVLLEIACGVRPAASPGSGRQPKRDEAAVLLLNRVRDMYDRNAVLDAADGRLQEGAFDERQMERVLVTGLWCAHRDRSRRPPIAEAMAVLRSERSELPVLPAAAPHGGLGQISALEERAYGDLSTEDKTTLSSDSTAYLSPVDSGELLVEE